MKEAAVCLQAQGIDNDDGGVRRVRQDRGLSDNDGNIVIGQGTDDASEGLETTPEAARYQRRARGIYNDD